MAELCQEVEGIDIPPQRGTEMSDMIDQIEDEFSRIQKSFSTLLEDDSP
jgi:hypothetical protein